MSEELYQRGLTEHGTPVGPYEYYNIGATTIGSLKKFKIVPDRDYGRATANKPDGVLADRRDLKNLSVILVVEHKSPQEFDTPAKKQRAIEQCVEDSCKPLGAKLAVVTDTREYIWVNPQLPGEKEYAVISREDGYPLHVPFQCGSDTEVEQTLLGCV